MIPYPSKPSDLLSSTRRQHIRQGFCKWPLVMRDGKEAHPLYPTWYQMRARCYSKSSSGWKKYGARGVRVCSRWYINFWAFIEDMGPKLEGYSLDRINPEGDYSPENCRWADSYTQAINTSKPRKGNILVLPSGRYQARIRRKGKYQGRIFDSREDAQEWLNTVVDTSK